MKEAEMQEFRRKEIRIQADAFREKCKVSRYGIIDLFKDCERLGYKLIRYPLGEEADLGFSMKKENDMIIFTNSSSCLAREIFTLAHEVGHTILHMGNTLSFVDDRITISGQSTTEGEQEANYFAACLLMPDDEVDKFLDLELEGVSRKSLMAMDIARMMSEFNVSFEMVLNRLESLHKINSQEKLLLDSERNQKRVGNLLRSVGGNRRLNESGKEIAIPAEYLEWVICNYNHNAIPMETLEKALSYYHLTIEDIQDKLTRQTAEDG